MAIYALAQLSLLPARLVCVWSNFVPMSAALLERRLGAASFRRKWFFGLRRNRQLWNLDQFPVDERAFDRVRLDDENIGSCRSEKLSRRWAAVVMKDAMSLRALQGQVVDRRKRGRGVDQGVQLGHCDRLKA